MKKIFILSLLMIMLGVFNSTAKAAEDISTTDAMKHVDFLRVGLKKISGKKINLKTQGEYLLNNLNIKDGEKIELSLSENKVYYKEKAYNTVDIKPKASTSRILIVYGKKTHTFSGSFEIRPNKGKLLPINIVSIEDYVEGVLPYEMSSTYPIEALKAQAVSARNYAISSLNKHRNEKFDVCDGIHCQVYKGTVEGSESIRKAVKETKGEILTHNNKVVRAFFYASNGGHTESSKNVWNSDYSYLVSKPDEFDNYKWNKKYTSSEIESILKRKGYISRYDTFKKIGAVSTNNSGRNSKIQIVYLNSNGEEKIKNLVGEQPRIVFSLKSSMFDVNYSNSEYSFAGKGFGHGVGMSQYGARNRAEKGHNYKDILSFYYPNTKIQDIK